jgi:isoamylase
MSYFLQHRTNRPISSGTWYPLGACPNPTGVNFAIYSMHAREVFLLLFDHPDEDPSDIILLETCTRYVWHTFVHGLKAGQLYGYKVRGEFNPAHGLRFNEHKLLIDPYAKALSGKFRNSDNLLLPYDSTSPLKDLSIDTRDNTPHVPKSIVIEDQFDWRGDKPPNIPLEELCIYEVHLKGFTAHPSSGTQNPGTYSGFIEKIPYLKALGINAVELLPIHEIYVEDFLKDKGLTNYWGYNTIGFFAPESSYGTRAFPGCEVAEFKTLVRELHAAGIEVILDVVYNHSGEGNELGPVLCFKGIDNPTYYVLTGDSSAPSRYYMNYTGTGNSLNLANTHVIRFVMDSLRYWTETMHVDGFRFDLASVLGREGGMYQKSASFFDAISQDPILARVKLIAEPWDIGSYEVGNFPVDWSEWNGRFRDTVRRFGKGDPRQVPDLGWRLSGSADLYQDDGRHAYNSINLITCHDGFTLYDLVSYGVKHNEANLENNNDGSNDNNSWNCGVEGETTDPAVIALRKQLAKNYICMLFFSMGTPMMTAGDEILRTQRGNNNAYCQDNDISWFDWAGVHKNVDVLEFVRKTIAFTKRYPVLQNRSFLHGKDLNDDSVPDVSWFGNDLSSPPWHDTELRTLSLRLDGGERQTVADRYYLFIVFNGDYQLQQVAIPPSVDHQWYRVIDTSLPAGEDFLETGNELIMSPADFYLANPRSTVLLLGR